MKTPNLKRVGYSSLRYNSAACRYVNEKGRFIAPDRVREIVDADIANRSERMQALAEKVASGEINATEFGIAMKREVKALHLVNVAAARGGIHNMGPEGFGQAGGLVRFHYQRLSVFVADIENGRYGEPPSLAAVADRASLYAEAGRSSYEYVRRQQEGEQGFNYEENELEPGAHHCTPQGDRESCRQQTDKGRVPTGTLVLVGLRACTVRCKCKVRRYKTLV